jgi:hypothetical protein
MAAAPDNRELVDNTSRAQPGKRLAPYGHPPTAINTNTKFTLSGIRAGVKSGQLAAQYRPRDAAAANLTAPGR